MNIDAKELDALYGIVLLRDKWNLPKNIILLTLSTSAKRGGTAFYFK